MYLFMSRRFRESAISPCRSCRGFGRDRFLVCGPFSAVLPMWPATSVPAADTKRLVLRPWLSSCGPSVRQGYGV